ncbi:MAG: dethiobiotin synthase [Planctomycetota bacterium]|nr:dethiobiotin synthase [Planctomycetota bacterium]
MPSPMPNWFPNPPLLRKPGLFITATDTGVGKTTITCAIARALRRESQRMRVGVCKPMATGCRRDREGLVSEDAEALAHFADCRQPLDVINPVRYVLPVAPAVAAEATGEPIDRDAIARSLTLLDESSDVVLVEGVGGVMVPIDGRHPRVTVLDLAASLGYPVLVVCRAGLGTLNHTSMTVRLLRDAGCMIAGVVINGYVADTSLSESALADASMVSNRRWIEKMTGLPILAVSPACPVEEVVPHQAKIPPAILDAVALTYWSDVAGAPTSGV